MTGPSAMYDEPCVVMVIEPLSTAACEQTRFGRLSGDGTADAVLFDVDGVLIGTADAHRRVWARAWAWGLDPEAAWQAMQGRRRADILRSLAPERDPAGEHRLLDRSMAAGEPGFRAFGGAARLLRALPPDRWAVVTSGRAEPTVRIAWRRFRRDRAGIVRPDAWSARTRRPVSRRGSQPAARYMRWHPRTAPRNSGTRMGVSSRWRRRRGRFCGRWAVGGGAAGTRAGRPGPARITGTPGRARPLNHCLT
ncbi:HAD family hydrolase [Streptomyces europaeiscabiei]|uniref:hypothetical protein n=1 Tax=Streptomyces europaeiscabiei TaxID=146819 RepID=UPI0038F61303